MWLQLHAHLLESEPTIWRRFCVPAKIPLSRLHKALQALFNWKNYHLYEFEVKGVTYSDPETNYDWDSVFEDAAKMTLAQSFSKVGDRILYRYDFGDDWNVELRLEAKAEEGSTRVLGGERAGPPEDCGGTYGLHQLNQVLANPKHPEHKRMREWAGRSYKPDHVDLESLNRKLIRLFPAPKQRTLSSAVDPAQPLDFTPVGPRLENYNLSKLSLRTAMLATLAERGQPMSLEDIAQRIQAAGVSLAEGAVTLKKAWRLDPVFYQRRDQRLEINLDHPEIWRHDFDLTEHWICPPSPEKGPLTAEEIEAVLKGHPNLSLAEWTAAVADSLGNPSLSQFNERLTALGKKFKGDLITIESGTVTPTDTIPAIRQKIRTTLAKMDRHERGHQQRANEAPPAYPWHLVCWKDDHAYIRELPSGQEFSLQGPPLVQFLQQARVIFAAQVFQLYDHHQILAHPETRRYDLMPAEHLDNRRQYAPGLTLEDLIRATFRSCYAANAPLEKRMPYHAALLAYGQLHGFIKAPQAIEYPRVYWDIGLQGSLRHRFEFALKNNREIWISHRPKDPLRPELTRQPLQIAQVGYDSVSGSLAGTFTTLLYKDIYLAPSPPCFSEFGRSRYRLTQPQFLTGWGYF